MKVLFLLFAEKRNGNILGGCTLRIWSFQNNSGTTIPMNLVFRDGEKLRSPDMEFFFPFSPHVLIITESKASPLKTTLPKKPYCF